jgi:hypothetical protein
MSACNQPEKQQTAQNAGEPGQPVDNQGAQEIPPPGTGPNARTPLAEPKGTIDPKSVEAAGQVVQHFGALIEQGRYDDAANLWGDAHSAAAFMKELRPKTHLEMGDLEDAEGAAGSVYTTVPVVFYGDSFRRPAQVILRRVNDVPGSTDAQRRWHIERIDWGKD